MSIEAGFIHAKDLINWELLELANKSDSLLLVDWDVSAIWDLSTIWRKTDTERVIQENKPK